MHENVGDLKGIEAFATHSPSGPDITIFAINIVENFTLFFLNASCSITFLISALRKLSRQSFGV